MTPSGSVGSCRPSAAADFCSGARRRWPSFLAFVLGAVGLAAGCVSLGVGAASALRLSLSAARLARLPLAFGAGASPSPASCAMMALTFTPSVPASTISFAMTPSSTASTSIVALSVSISAITSPGFTVSPSFTSHLASLPSSMVGDSAGIRMSVIDQRRLHQHVGPQLGRIAAPGCPARTRALSFTISRISASIFLRPSSVAWPASSSLRLQHLDRVVMLAHLLHFLACAVLGGVGHRVAAIAVGLHLEDVRALRRRARAATAFAAALRTASTSMPSTSSPGISKEMPRLKSSVSAEARAIEVPMAYWLFSIT